MRWPRNFDRALGLVKSAVETGASRAAYLDGSFGSGKSHFMAVLYAILDGDADARGKRKLADVVHKHDTWLQEPEVPPGPVPPPGLPEPRRRDPRRLCRPRLQGVPGRPLPAVFRDDELLADARDLRERSGDDAFIAQLPAADEEWGEPDWDAKTLDEAFSEGPGGRQRRRLIGDLLAGPFQRYARAVKADQESYIPLDEGLSEISKHARNVLGFDAIVLLLDELVLWLAGYLGDHTKVSIEAQKVSKLVESAEYERPAPIISFIPRQRDLRDLVSKAAAGAEVTTLFDTLKYWDGRFDSIRLDDRNLPEIAHERLLKPKDDHARRLLDEAFTKAANVPQQTWDILLDTHGEQGDRKSFQLTYPFSPAFVHAMVDISSALQRERTALKLMQQLLVDYRDSLEIGKLMPLGAIFDVLASGADRPFTDKLRDEFEKAKRFYTLGLRPALLRKHKITEEQAKAPAARLPRRRPCRQDPAARRARAERARPQRPDRHPPGRAQPRLDRDHAAEPGACPGRAHAQDPQRAVRRDPAVRQRGRPAGGPRADRRGHRGHHPRQPARRRRRRPPAPGQGPALEGARPHRRRGVRDAGEDHLARHPAPGRRADGQRPRRGADAEREIRGQPRHAPDGHRLSVRRGQPFPGRGRAPCP